MAETKTVSYNRDKTKTVDLDKTVEYDASRTITVDRVSTVSVYRSRETEEIDLLIGDKLRSLSRFLELLPNIKSDWKLDDFDLSDTAPEAHGAYGVVKIARDKRSGKRYAIKTIRFAKIKKQQRLADEIVHSAIVTGCPNICGLAGYFYVSDAICIVYDLCGTELYDKIINNSLDGLQIVRYFYQLLRGVCCMHKRKILHLDIKPENILVDIDDNIRVIDYGASQFTEFLENRFVGTPTYMAPEMIFNSPNHITDRLDVWSCGVVLYTMIFRTNLFRFPEHYKSHEDLILQLRRTHQSLTIKYYFNKLSNIFESRIIHYIVQLLDMMLKTDPAMRCSIYDAKEHIKIFYNPSTNSFI
jgi:serine/threonine protein kinase